MSIPVDIPIPFNIYRTSSVATFPLAPLAYGQPPSPATAESMEEMPYPRAVYKFTSACP